MTAEWVQALTGIAAIILAIVSIFQNIRIKSLENIAKTMSDQYELNREITMKDRMPFFIIAAKRPIANNLLNLIIRNGGQLVSKIVIKDQVGEHYSATVRSNADKPYQTFLLNIRAENDQLSNFDFKIEYKSYQTGHIYTQRIYKFPGHDIAIEESSDPLKK